MLFLSKLECEAINNAERRDELERQKSKFKWICCDAILVSGNVGGCKKGKHGFNANNNGNLSLPQQHLAHTTADNLPQATIQDWEEACFSSEEYNDKWLLLLQDRG